MYKKIINRDGSKDVVSSKMELPVVTVKIFIALNLWERAPAQLSQKP